MSVTATFHPDRVAATPGETAALTLQLQNTSDTECMVKLRAGGGLADQTVLQTEIIYLDPNEHFEVPVIVDAHGSLAAGMHSCVIEIDHDGEASSAVASVEILEAANYTARLEPVASRSSAAGRHKIAVENGGNVPLMVELAPATSELLHAELAATAVNIEPGKTAKVELRLTPYSRFWNGPPHDHEFSIAINGSNGARVQLDGSYQQGPRVRPWFAPALAGMAGALVIGGLAWFLLLKPSVEDAAEDRAAELDAAQDAALQTQVAAIEQAADEASELPLGQPVDLRLDATAAPATSDSTAFVFDESGVGRELSITDVIFQNPSGAVGVVELLRDDQVLLQSNMANFRDLDFHLVAPFRVNSRSEISLRVACDAPGPGTEACAVAATIVGFVDDV